MTVHAAFAEELARPQNPDHGLLLMLGDHRDLDLPPLNVIDGVGRVALHEHGFILLKTTDGLAGAHLGEKVLGVKRALRWISQSEPPLAQAKLASGGSTTLSVTEISPERSDDMASMHAWLSRSCSVLLRKSAMRRLDRTTSSGAPASHHLVQVSNIAHYEPCGEPVADAIS